MTIKLSFIDRECFFCIIASMDTRQYLSSTYFKLFMQANQHLISATEQDLEIPLSSMMDKPFVNGEVVEKLFELFHHNGIDCWALHHGKQLGVSSHGPLGFTVLTAPDLNTAIEVTADYSIIRTSFYNCHLRRKGRRIEFIFDTTSSSDLTNCWMVEIGINVIRQLIETIVSHPLGNNAHIHFRHSKPAYHTQLQQLYGINCDYNQPDNMISIPSSWCQISSPLSEPATYESNLRKCNEIKQQLAGEQDIVSFVQDRLKNYFSGLDSVSDRILKMPTLESLAQEKYMAPRTLARHLEKHDSSYRKILADARQVHACELLTQTHLSIVEISVQLAYQEPANFIRAFKSWYKITPSQWRRNNSQNRKK